MSDSALTHSPPPVPPASPDASRPGCGPLRIDAGPAGGRAEPQRGLRRQAFERIRAAGRLSRIDLAKGLGVSPASVTTLSAELLAEGLIVEAVSARREGDGARGRPPVALAVRPEARRVAGLNLSDHADTAVILDFAGGELARVVRPRDALGEGAEGLAAQAAQALDAALAQAGLARVDLAAVGAGLPGVVDHGAGLATWSPLLSERNVPLAQALSDVLGLPTAIDNDANLLALGEQWFGAGRAEPDFAVVTVENGVGMGLVMGGALWRGAAGPALEIGHTKVELDGALCRCGRRGCLEAYVADYALLREAQAYDAAMSGAGAGAPPRTVADLQAAARAGDASARSILRRSARYLGLALGNLANLLDPPLILLAGDRLSAGDEDLQATLEEMRALVLDQSRAPPRVLLREGGGPPMARGAAAMALQTATDAALRRSAA